MNQPPPLPPHNPYAAPAARLDEGHSGELVLADRGTRFAAALVDGLMVGGLGVLAAVMIPMFAGREGQPANPVALAVVVLVAVGGLIALLVINLILLYRNGQTIAKRLFNIKIVRTDGQRCELARIIFMRALPINLISNIPLIGPFIFLVDALFIFREDRRCLHDLIADSIVVRA